MSASPASRIPDKIREAVVEDYAAGMSTEAVAIKYGMGSATAHRIVKAAGINRSVKGAKDKAYDREYGLNNGHWTPNKIGVQVWQPCFYDSAESCNIDHRRAA